MRQANDFPEHERLSGELTGSACSPSGDQDQSLSASRRRQNGELPQDWPQLISCIAKQQDEAAFAALFAFYAPRVKGLMMRSGVTAEAAEDIAQETMLIVWRKAATYDLKRTNVSAWIYTIARNLLIDRLRRERLAALHALYEMSDEEEPERPYLALESVERERQVHAAIRRLSPDQVRVIQLAFFQDHTNGALASLMGIPLGTAKSHLRRAMSRLRAFLGHLK
jgi:RNA polymerase sigma-70 factor (ECF subfamily)